MKNYTLIEGVLKLDYKLGNYKDVEIELNKKYIENFSNLEHYLKSNYRKEEKPVFDMKYNEGNYVRLINDLLGKERVDEEERRGGNQR